MSARKKPFVPTKPASTRSSSSTPTKAARPAPTTRASSEVRQAILALKAKQGATRSRQASLSPLESEEQEISQGEQVSSPLASSSSFPAFDNGDEDFGPSVSSVIEKAKANGRLILASRSLQAVPSEVYSALISPANPLHPSNKQPKAFFKTDQVVDLSISRSEEDDSSNVRWYEQTPLTVLKLSNNEIDHLEEELGGLTDLENLDVHCNCLSAVPLSISNLASLTVLNLSSNRLEGSIPLPILNLEHLASLDLSNNKLTSLWSEDWRSQLKDCLSKPAEADDSFNTESSQGEDFWSTFPSSPVKQRTGSAQETLTPFPSLRILNLSHNRLPTNALTLLPSSLVQLDLSSNALFTTLPPLHLEDLETLNLSSNEIPDTVFHPSSTLPKLTSLDLSNNALSTLAHLDSHFGSINYIAVPPALAKMIKPTTSTLSIRIAGNVLSAEPSRRRAIRNQASAFPILPPQQPQIRQAAASDDSYKTAEGGEDELPEELAKLVLGQKAFPYAEEISNGILDLSGRGMECFPTGEKCEGEVKALNLAKNGLTEVPMQALVSWGLFQGLQKLDLSRNRIITFSESASFQALTHLDLSANRLAIPGIFDILSRVTPNLKNLDLTYNMLDNLQGVQPLLLRPGGGLRSLKLSGNRFADVSPLAEVAVQIKAGASGWACEEIDIRDCDIGKLQPELGWLPLSSFLVEGNVFRIPQRRVWESGGTAGLLQWLKDKIA